MFSKGFVTDYPLTIRHREGGQTNVLYNASVYKDVRGNVLGVFAAARDVTAQKRAEAEVAEQRGKELERFQKLTVGRELKMIELKKEIAELKKGLVMFTLGPTIASAELLLDPTAPIATSPSVRLMRTDAPGPSPHPASQRSSSSAARMARAASVEPAMSTKSVASRRRMAASSLS